MTEGAIAILVNAEVRSLFDGLWKQNSDRWWFRSPTSWRSRGSRLQLRSLIDPKYPLFFYDEGYSADIELNQKTTQEQIVNLFVSQVEQPSWKCALLSG
jgi:hypothetical protein